jgi:hypothetical protein
MSGKISLKNSTSSFSTKVSPPESRIGKDFFLVNGENFPVFNY